MFVFETASFSGALFVVVERVFVRSEEEKTRGSVCVIWRSLVRLSFARGKSISYCVSVSFNE